MTELTIEIVEGPEAGRQVSVDGPLEIGRDPAVDVVLQDANASRRHARIAPVAGRALIEDLESRNGTWVNGQPIYGPTMVGVGDTVLIGVTVMELRSAEQIARHLSAVLPVPAPLARPEPQIQAAPPLAAPAGQRPLGAGPTAFARLDPLRDVRVRAKARTAPLAVFILVVFVVLIYLAQRAHSGG